MDRKIITEKERIGECCLKFPITVKDAISYLHQIRNKYGNDIVLLYDTEWNFEEYPDGFLEFKYDREETDLEFETRLKRIKTAKIASAKGIAKKKENMLKSDRLAFKNMKKKHPKWFEIEEDNNELT